MDSKKTKISNKCRLTTCRFNKSRECTDAANRKFCLDVVSKVLDSNHDEIRAWLTE